jgi:hypothetical protein
VTLSYEELDRVSMIERVMGIREYRVRSSLTDEYGDYVKCPEGPAAALAHPKSDRASHPVHRRAPLSSTLEVDVDRGEESRQRE